MTSLLRSLTFLWILILSVNAQISFGAGSTPDIKTQVISEYSTAQKGEPFYLYLELQHAPGWYSYYFNNLIGSTIRPDLSFPETPGVTIGATEYPKPKVKESYETLNYIFEGLTYFRVPVLIDKSFTGNSLDLTATAHWQVCKTSCLPPASREHAISISLGDQGTINPSLPSNATKSFANTNFDTQAQLSSSGIELTINSTSLSEPTFYDLDGQTSLGTSPKVSSEGDQTTITLELDAGNDFRSDSIAPQERLRGYLTSGDTIAWIDTPLTSTQAPALAATPPATEQAIDSTTPLQTKSKLIIPSDEELAKYYDPSVSLAEGPGLTFGIALIGAFFGGILLNLMPCVFPVLSLKVLSFVEKAGEESWKVRLHGMLFTLGVVLSMWVLAIALFTIKKSTGQDINWGQQMSYPVFVGAIIIVLFIFGLNMAGIFEIGTKLTSAGSNVNSKNEYTSTIFSGVLTTVIATPCSGPFLGAAMGYTLSQSLFVALILFTVFALGIAFPYLLLSFFPALTSKLPRPGAWMETLKKLLSFGMFAAAAFFMQTFGALTGGSGLAALIMGLVLIALATYTYGHWSMPHLKKSTRYTLGFGLSLVVLIIGLTMSWKAATQHTPPASTSSVSKSTNTKGISWIQWKPGIVEYLRSEGYYVWVDYTATWCATCQVNKKTIFGNSEFVSSLDPEKIILVKADLTNRDPKIAKDLSRTNRVTIPVNLLYAPQSPSKPTLLEDLISVNDAKKALETLKF